MFTLYIDRKAFPLVGEATLTTMRDCAKAVKEGTSKGSTYIMLDDCKSRSNGRTVQKRFGFLAGGYKHVVPKARLADFIAAVQAAIDGEVREFELGITQADFDQFYGKGRFAPLRNEPLSEAEKV